MTTNRSACVECNRMKQDAMKLRMDIASLQASNRALIDKQKIIEQRIKEQQLQLRQQELSTPEEAAVGAGAAEELDRVKAEYFALRQELEALRDGLHSRDSQLAEAERRAQDAENWIQIKDSMIEKQRNLLKEMDATKTDLQVARDASKALAEKAQLELSKALDEMAVLRSDVLRLQAPDQRDKVRVVADDVDETCLQRELDRARGDLSRAEAAKMALENDLAASKRRVALKDASVKSLQAALESERAETAQKENSHLLLDSENAYLRSENASLKEELERAQVTLQGVEERAKEQEAELNQKTESAAELLAKIEAADKEQQELQERLQDFEVRLRCAGLDIACGTEASPAEPTIAANEDSCSGPPQPGEEACLAAVSEKITRQETQIADLNALLSYRESCILKMHEEMESMRDAMGVANTEKDTLNASITILKKELGQAREEAKGKREAVTELESKLEEIRTKRSREYDRRKRAETEADELYRENEELRHRVAKLEAKGGDVKSRDPLVSDLQASCKELQSTVKELRTDNEAKRSELFDLRAKLDQKLTQIEEQQSRVKARDRTITELRNQIYGSQSTMEKSLDEANQLRAELQSCKEEQKRSKQDLQSILASNQYLGSSCAELRTKLAAKDRQLADLNEKMQTIARHSQGDSSPPSKNGSPGAFQVSVEVMTAQLKDLNDDRHRLEQEAAEERAKTLKLELELAAAAGEASKARAVAESARSEGRRLQSELSRAKEDSDRLSAELRQVVVDKEAALSRKRRAEGEELAEKRRRLENGSEMCAQCELLGREISQVESYLNQKDAEFNRLTEQLQDSQEQEAALRNELFRTNGELQEARLRVRTLEVEARELTSKCRALSGHQEQAAELMRALQQANRGFEQRLTGLQEELALRGTSRKPVTA